MQHASICRTIAQLRTFAATAGVTAEELHALLAQLVSR